MKTLLSGAVLLLVTLPLSADVSSFTNPLPPIEGGAVLDCTGVEDYQQPLDAANFNTARTSDEQPTQQVWEDLVDGAGAITPLPDGTIATDMRIWGLSLEFNAGFVATCIEDHTANTPYNISIFADNAGAPAAAPLATTTATPTAINDTAIPFAFTTIFEYDLSFDTPLDMTGAAWISAVRQTGVQAGNGNDCYFLWVDETLVGSYDDAAFSVANGAEPTDQTMCMATGVPAVPVIEVPTLDKVALAGLALLLLSAGIVAVRRFN